MSKEVSVHPVPPQLEMKEQRLSGSTPCDSVMHYSFRRTLPSVWSPNIWHRKHSEGRWGFGTRLLFGFLMTLTEILLWGSISLAIYWVMKYREGFAWHDQDRIQQVFNLHPVLMIAGFVFFMGHAMLMYRTNRCCGKLWNKVFHVIFHMLAAPCIGLAFFAVFDYHSLRIPATPHFYSLHSWLGLTTMGLFSLQFLMGFFSFIVLLCCDSATESYREKMVPVHGTFGIVTFMLAVATAATGLTEKAIFTFDGITSPFFHEFPNEGIVINVLCMSLVGLAILLPFIISYRGFRPREKLPMRLN